MSKWEGGGAEFNLLRKYCVAIRNQAPHSLEFFLMKYFANQSQRDVIRAQSKVVNRTSFSNCPQDILFV